MRYEGNRLLKLYLILIQDSQLLEPDMNLVDQCVQGEGLVQIICEIKEEDNLKKINIVDVLKPPEPPEEPQRYISNIILQITSRLREEVFPGFWLVPCSLLSN